MKIFIASDHAGFRLKEKLKNYLEKKYSVRDFGAKSFDKKDDYPDFIIPLARKLSKEKNAFGIIFGYSGEGEAMAANKVNGIRAGVYNSGNLKIVKLMRQHNNANVLSLGAGFVSETQAKKAVNIFLSTNFEKGRHLRRLNKIPK